MNIDALYTTTGKTQPPATEEAVPPAQSARGGVRYVRQAFRQARHDERKYRIAKPLIRAAREELAIDTFEVWEALTDEEREALLRKEITAEELRAFCFCLAASAARTEGGRPSHYTQHATCAHCGPVWLWQGAPEKVQSCPWCYNRGRGLPIPRPIEAACCECGRFTPATLNPTEGLGGCAMKAAGLPWPKRVGCHYWIPGDGRQG